VVAHDHGRRPPRQLIAAEQPRRIGRLVLTNARGLRQPWPSRVMSCRSSAHPSARSWAGWCCGRGRGPALFRYAALRSGKASARPVRPDRRAAGRVHRRQPRRTARRPAAREGPAGFLGRAARPPPNHRPPPARWAPGPAGFSDHPTPHPCWGRGTTRTSGRSGGPAGCAEGHPPGAPGRPGAATAHGAPADGGTAPASSPRPGGRFPTPRPPVRR